MPAKLTTAIFINRARAQHGKRYDYSLSKYRGAKVKIEIICKEHGMFKQQPNVHWAGSGCPICSRRLVALGNRLSPRGSSDYRVNRMRGDGHTYSTGNREQLIADLYENN